MPAVRSTWVAFAELDTTATCMPASIAAVRNRSDPGYGSTPCSVSSAVNSAFFRLPRAHTVSLPGASSGVPSGSSMPRARSRERTPS